MSLCPLLIFFIYTIPCLGVATRYSPASSYTIVLRPMSSSPKEGRHFSWTPETSEGRTTHSPPKHRDIDHSDDSGSVDFQRASTPGEHSEPGNASLRPCVCITNRIGVEFDLSVNMKSICLHELQAFEGMTFRPLVTL